MKDLIHSLKYEKMRGVGAFFGEWMGYFVRKRYDDPIILPIPLHHVKKRERGYNQCEEIGKGLIKTTSWEMRTDILKRTKYTQTQTAMNLDERIENMRSVFHCRRAPEDPSRTVILLDDLYTTGSTTSAAAAVLTEAGYEDIRVLTVATPLFTGDQKKGSE